MLFIALNWAHRGQHWRESSWETGT